MNSWLDDDDFSDLDYILLNLMQFNGMIFLICKVRPPSRTFYGHLHNGFVVLPFTTGCIAVHLRICVINPSAITSASIVRSADLHL